MTRTMLVPGALILALGTVWTATAADETLTTARLIDDLTDLRTLAEYPAPSYVCRQFSSYDRASTSAEKQETWFANGDAGQFLRIEEQNGRKEYVMMDADGPGAIVRIWSANPKGTLRIYVDEATESVIAVPMTDLLGGKVPELPEPLSGVTSAGWNLYFPIPYAKHCKVTSDDGGFYYHIDYRTYATGTAVQTFKWADVETAAAAIEKACKVLKTPREAAALFGTEQSAPNFGTANANATLQPGASQTLESKGGGAIVGLKVTAHPQDAEQTLRKMLLTIEFDGTTTVTAPLADFFGAGPGIQSYQSLPLGVDEDGTFWCNWVMPFREHAVLSIKNLNDEPIDVQAAWLVDGRYRWTDRSMYFHAGWRVQRDIPTRPFLDWNYVTVDGEGVFVGAAFAINNPVKGWWGEGDEKIYLDGEKFPSFFGTGTEDYYGYAWCSPQTFQHAYHNQPRCDGPDNFGRTAVNRWHIIDAIPFTKKFQFDMELWHSHGDTKILEASVLTYWYARPGATSNRDRLAPQDLRTVPALQYDAPRVAGAIEGEQMRVLQHTGDVHKQDIAGCSNEKHLWWIHAKPGDRLEAEFDAPAAGPQRVLAHFVKAADYGIVQVYVNGVKLGTPIDLYNENVAVSDELYLGTADLNAGANTLTLEIVGANKQAVQQFMVGLDYIRLEAVE